MPTPYEYTYGDVKFYDLGGTLVLDTQASAYALYLVEDTEPSPDPKWVRVEVPGADGAVDLSRALTGQVQYATREITLRFAGSQATHALALGVVRTFRKLLHGQRLRVATMLTTQVSGYYVADVECDGTADPSGIVEITVTATCDPFIRTGTQTLALTASSTGSTTAKLAVTTPNANLLKGAGTIGASYASTAYCPVTPTTARLWWARGKNLLDVSRWTVRGWVDPSGTRARHDVEVVGQAIHLGAVDAAKDYYVDVVATGQVGITSHDVNYAVGLPFLTNGTTYSRTVGLVACLSGTISSVSSPSVRIATIEMSGIDADGYVTGAIYSSAANSIATPAAGDYADDRITGFTHSKTGTEHVCAVRVSVSGIESDDLVVTVGASSSAQLTAYEEAILGYATVDFGGTWLVSSYLSATDTATICPWGEVAVTHNLKATANSLKPAALSPAVTTTGSVDGWPPTDATCLCLAAVDAYGNDCPSCLLTTSYATIGTKTGSNTTMRSTPTVTTTGGAYVKLGGRVAIVPSGAQELQALTVPGGSFSVDYATLDGQAGTLTWEGGVL